MLLGAVSVMAVSVWQLLKIYKEYRAGEDAYEEIASLADGLREEAFSVSGTGKKPEGETGENSETAESESVAAAFDPEAYALWFQELRAVNPDIAAWIQIADTKINYPVMYSGDNEYYLYRTWQKSENGAGSIFLEGANAPDFSDYHSVIYGHNMKNGTMFAGLHAYRDESFYREHPDIELDMPEGPRVYRIFSCHEIDAGSDLYRVGYRPGESFTELVNRMKALSDYDTGVEVTGESPVITLSTCIGNGNRRYVVHAVLISS